MYTISQVRKAIGVATSGALAWATLVVASPASGVTAGEWLGLGGIGLAVLACFGLTNEAAPPPVPELLPPPSQPLTQAAQQGGLTAGPGA
jgi:hypothetical protein